MEKQQVAGEKEKHTIHDDHWRRSDHQCVAFCDGNDDGKRRRCEKFKKMSVHVLILLTEESSHEQRSKMRHGANNTASSHCWGYSYMYKSSFNKSSKIHPYCIRGDWCGTKWNIGSLFILECWSNIASIYSIVHFGHYLSAQTRLVLVDYEYT